MSVPRKTPAQFEAIRASAGVLSEALNVAARTAVAGVSTSELDARIDSFLRTRGAEPVLVGRRGGKADPYRHSSCISVNEQAVHTPPGARVLCDGDLVSLDATARVGGWCADAAVSVAVGGGGRALGLIDGVRACLRAGLEEMFPGRAWSAVAGAVQQAASDRSLHLLEGFDGHGIGRELHEPPRCWLTGGPSAQCPDFDLRVGMVLTLEPVLLEHDAPVAAGPDGWAVVAGPGCWACHEEIMVAIRREGPCVLTRTPSLP